jgi:type III pantothenate kinase
MGEAWLIDLGSSRVKWQVRSETGAVMAEGRDDWSAVSAKPTLPSRRPAEVWLARVGPEARERTLVDWLRDRYGDVPVHSVRPRIEGPAGLSLDYDHRQLGADRYCALLGVLARSREPAVVIDAGTAVTLDLLAADGRHLGGYIMPGFRAGLAAVSRLFPDALQAQVASLLEADPSRRDAACRPGHDTGEALFLGWMHGLAAALDRLGSSPDLRQYGEAEWWITGGDGPWLAGLLGRPVRVEPDLVFDGLWLCKGEQAVTGGGPG